jgi:hypothetical protein
VIFARFLVRRSLSFVVALVIFAGGAALASPVVREQAVVSVNGVKEIWRLVWADTPTSVCGLNDVESASTCPCSGFAYGERGQLYLDRIRAGKQIEHMNLGPLFDGAEWPDSENAARNAFLQRWPIKPNDWEQARQGVGKLRAEITKRSKTKILNFADYNRDGSFTEFLLQVGTLPCGKRQFVAVGVSPKDNRLHALSSTENPSEPLIMFRSEWEALLMGPGPHRVIDWQCGDHASEEEDDLIVSASGGNIHVQGKTYACRDDGTRGQPIPNSVQ